MTAYEVLIVLSGFVFLYSLVASRLAKTPINGAVVYVFVGLLCGPTGLALIEIDVEAEELSWLAELTLAVVLFTDASNAKLSVLRSARAIPIRLLLVGLPLTILAGFGLGTLIFQDLGLLEVALLATLLAPTDAALGQAVVQNESVPTRIRESLSVESGLNDGICVPVLLLFLALASGEANEGEALSLLVSLPLQAIGIGALVGFGMGLLGVLMLRSCYTRGWIQGAWLQVPIVALAVLSFAFAQRLEGSGFIACFLGGLTFGALANRDKEKVLESGEGAGLVLSMLTWFAFGTLLFSKPYHVVDWRVIVYAIASLTVIRMVPVFLCVTGLGLRTNTKLFMGWFGPRGLASIVFAVMVINAKIPGADIVVHTATWTILLSVIAHGLTANPLSRLYGQSARQDASN